MIKNYFAGLMLLMCYSISFAQMKGNQNYRDRDRQTTYRAMKNDYDANDSTLSISVKILLNKKADKYLLTLGVMQKEKTPKECVSNINRRIDKTIAIIQALDIKKEDIFIDFISQTKTYDYVLTDKKAEEVSNGFLLKKNIVIALNKYEQIEQIILAAAENQIYDVVNLDYINSDIESIYDNLLNEATQVLNKKKNTYFAKFGGKQVGDGRAEKSFFAIFPNEEYDEYSAYETNTVEDNEYARLVKKTALKEKGFYYKKLNYSGFDKIINYDNPEVGIEYVLDLKLTYILEKTKHN